MLTPQKLCDQMVERCKNYRHLGEKKGRNNRSNIHFHIAKFIEAEAPKLLRNNDDAKQIISLTILLCGAVSYLTSLKSKRLCRDRLQPLLNDVFNQSGMTEAQFRRDYDVAIQSAVKLIKYYNKCGGTGVMTKWARKKPKDVSFRPGDETTINKQTVTIEEKPLSPQYLQYLGTVPQTANMFNNE